MYWEPQPGTFLHPWWTNTGPQWPWTKPAPCGWQLFLAGDPPKRRRERSKNALQQRTFLRPVSTWRQAKAPGEGPNGQTKRKPRRCTRLLNGMVPLMCHLQQNGSWDLLSSVTWHPGTRQESHRKRIGSQCSPRIHGALLKERILSPNGLMNSQSYPVNPRTAMHTQGSVAFLSDSYGLFFWGGGNLFCLDLKGNQNKTSHFGSSILRKTQNAPGLLITYGFTALPPWPQAPPAWQRAFHRPKGLGKLTLCNDKPQPKSLSRAGLFG